MRTLHVLCVARSPFIVDALAVCLSYCPPVLQPVGRLQLDRQDPLALAERVYAQYSQEELVRVSGTIDLVVAAVGGRDIEYLGMVLSALGSSHLSMPGNCDALRNRGPNSADTLAGIPYGILVLDRTVSSVVGERGGWPAWCAAEPVFRCNTRGGFGTVCAEVLRYASIPLPNEVRMGYQEDLPGVSRSSDGNVSRISGSQCAGTGIDTECCYGDARECSPSLVPFQMLTGRELEIVRGVVRGLTAREIARELGISLHTVNCHRRHVYLKTGMGSVQELASYALTHQLVE